MELLRRKEPILGKLIRFLQRDETIFSLVTILSTFTGNGRIMPERIE